MHILVVGWDEEVDEPTNSVNLKGGKEGTQHLPKREVVRADWGGDILAGWEGRVGRERRGENYILRELGENVVEGEKAGEWEEQKERGEDDEYPLRHIKLFAWEDPYSHWLHLIHLSPLCILKQGEKEKEDQVLGRGWRVSAAASPLSSAVVLSGWPEKGRYRGM